MKTFKREIKAIEKSANKILEVCSLMKIASIKPPKAVAEELLGESDRPEYEGDPNNIPDIDAIEENRVDQDIAEDKVHEEEVVEPQDPTEVNI